MKIIEYIQKGKKYSVSKFDDDAEAFHYDLLACGEECRIIDIKEFPDPPGKPHYSCSGSGRMDRDFNMRSFRDSESIFNSDKD